MGLAPTFREPWLARLRALTGLLGLLWALHLPGIAAGQESLTADPRKVEAAFLRNFARYVIWPETAFADEGSPWCVGLLGGDPFGEVLERTLDGRTEQGRAFRIVRVDSVAELPRCQIVFVAYRDAEQRRAALARLAGRPILTVSDAAGFLQEGGVIRFRVSDRVEMGINLDQARAASLTIQTKMLEVAHEVLEDGSVRRRR